ncbi:MAG: hypothetical protein IPO39_18790 [Bacteroidetes bacterium]|nr:hypothetical protein [Bacteroidota bacterium]
MELTPLQFNEVIEFCESDQETSEALDFLSPDPKFRSVPVYDAICNVISGFISEEDPFIEDMPGFIASIKVRLIQLIQA